MHIQHTHAHSTHTYIHTNTQHTHTNTPKAQTFSPSVTPSCICLLLLTTQAHPDVREVSWEHGWSFFFYYFKQYLFVVRSNSTVCTFLTGKTSFRHCACECQIHRETKSQNYFVLHTHCPCREHTLCKQQQKSY